MTSEAAAAVGEDGRSEWKASFIEGLRKQDQVQRTFVQPFFEVYNKVARERASLRKEAKELTERVEKYKASALESKTSSAQTQAITDLTAQLSTLKDERTELYKTQAQHAQRILSLNESLTSLTSNLSKTQQDHSRLQALVQSAAKREEEYKARLREKDTALEILQDELTTVQMELNVMEERLKEVRGENAELVSRELERKRKEAERMNDELARHDSSGIGDRKPTTTQRTFTGTRLLRAHTSIDFQKSPASSSTDIHDTHAAFSPVDSYRRQKSSRGSRRAATSLPLNCRIPKRVVRKLTGDDVDGCCISGNPGGTLYAVGGGGKLVQLIDTRTGERVCRLSGCIGSILGLHFNDPDLILGEKSTADERAGDVGSPSSMGATPSSTFGSEALVLASTSSNAIRIWSVNTGRLLQSLTGHIGKVPSAKFATFSSLIASGSHDRTVRVWDLEKGFCTRTLFCVSSCGDLTWGDSSGNSLLSCHVDKKIRLWDVRSSQCKTEITHHEGIVTWASVVPFTEYELISGSRDNTFIRVDVRNPSDILSMYSHDSYRCGLNHSRATISPDATFLCAGSATGDIYFWDIAGGRWEAVLRLSDMTDYKASGSPAVGVWWNQTSESQIGSICQDGACYIWEH